jgi:hypothetical protein
MRGVLSDKQSLLLPLRLSNPLTLLPSRLVPPMSLPASLG